MNVCGKINQDVPKNPLDRIIPRLKSYPADYPEKYSQKSVDMRNYNPTDKPQYYFNKRYKS